MERRDKPKSVGREIAGNVGRAALEIPEVSNAVSGLLLLPLMIVFVPLGLAFLVVAGLVYYGVFAVLLGARGDLMGYIGGAYWIGVLGLMFLLFRGVYRWIARRNGLIARATQLGFGHEAPTVEAPAVSPPFVAAASTADETPSLAELDARLAPGSPGPRDA